MAREDSNNGNRPEESPVFLRQAQLPVPDTKEKVDSHLAFPV